MDNKEAYDLWSANYDKVINATRDLEKIALRKTLDGILFADVLEIGCGTGKNTQWLSENGQRIASVDFSPEMLNKAKEKIKAGNVDFFQADVNNDWIFVNRKFDLITCSLILEHIRNIDLIFQKASDSLNVNGYFYIGELHPFKQYSGSKARFETKDGEFKLDCYIHHISDFTNAGKQHNFKCIDVQEWFDNADKNSTPRLISFLFQKTNI